jgi:hypothetical protein
MKRGVGIAPSTFLSSLHILQSFRAEVLTGMERGYRDGTLRRNCLGFDGTKMPGVYVRGGVTADVGFRRRLLAAYDVVAQDGPAFPRAAE